MAATSPSRSAAPGAADPAAQKQPGDHEEDPGDRPGLVVEPVRRGDVPAERASSASGSDTPPPPPVTFAKCFAISGSETAMANVASASDTPASRSAGMPNSVADQAGDEPRERDREERTHPVRSGSQPGGCAPVRLRGPRAEDKDRGRVAADAHEGTEAERDLSVVAQQDVQPEQRDEVDRDEGELAQRNSPARCGTRRSSATAAASDQRTRDARASHAPHDHAPEQAAEAGSQDEQEDGERRRELELLARARPRSDRAG